MTNPIISIIVPLHNNALYIIETIASVLNQSFTQFEVIVIDDGSTDKSYETLSKYQNQIVYFNQENKGPAAARNKGLEISKGKYVMFLDADDIILEEKLLHQFKFLEENPNIDLVYSNGYRFQVIDGVEKYRELDKTGELLNKNLNKEDYLYHLMSKNIFPIHAALLRTEKLKSIGGFDEKLSACEDWDLWYRFAENYSIAYFDENLIKYRLSEKSNSSDLMRNYREVENVMEKISKSASFSKAPKKIIGNHYFHRALNLLNLQDNNNFIEYFYRAFENHPLNIRFLLGFILSKIFGKKTIIFFHLKRQILGSRGRKSI